jgi:TRAP-type C4-dicarboxylate transport system permease small subunit
MEIFSYVAVIIAVLALIWVGFQFIMAQGNSDRISELKTWFYYIIIGTAIILASRLIVSVVINTLESAGTVSPDVIQKLRQPLNNQ